MSFTQIDFIKLYETMIATDKTQDEIYEELLAKFKSENELDIIHVSDPAAKIIDILAFAKMLVDQRIKLATKQVLPGTAKGEFLDVVLGWLHNGKRLKLEDENLEAIPSTEAVYEDDETFLTRVMEGFQGQSYGGASTRYKFLAKTHSSNVKDVYVKTPVTEETAGEIDVYILTHDNDGVAPPALLNEIDVIYNKPNGVLGSKKRTLHNASIKPFELNATITLKEGADPAVVIQQLIKRWERYAYAQNSFGNQITKSGCYAALTIEGAVDNVDITDTHGGEILCQPHEVAKNTAHFITV